MRQGKMIRRRTLYLLTAVLCLFTVDSAAQGSAPSGVQEAIAASRGDTPEVRALVAGNDANARDAKFNRPAFMWAVIVEDLAAFRRLLNLAADVSATDGQGYTALHHAARFAGKFDTRPYVEALLMRGANPNAGKPGGMTPLMLAANAKNRAVVAMILAKTDSATLNARDQFGRTALASAAFLGAYEIIQLLLDRGAEADTPDKEGKTPLLLAAGAAEGATASVQLLLAAGANPNSRDRSGWTPLQEALKYGTQETQAMLRKAGAK